MRSYFLYMDCNDILALIVDWLGPGDFAAFALVNRQCAAVCRALAESKRRTFVVELIDHEMRLGVLLSNRLRLHGGFAKKRTMSIYATYVRGKLHGQLEMVFNEQVTRYEYRHGQLISQQGQEPVDAPIFTCIHCGNQVIGECDICALYIARIGRKYVFDPN